MELSHQSHEHSLFFVDGESDTHEPVLCWGCSSTICGARYSCSTCHFHLHKSCTELPPRLEDHPFHPQHPLSLLYGFPYKGRYVCHACGFNRGGKNFVYNCSQCDFGIHALCALSVDLNGGKELFRYGSCQHLLMLEEEQSTSLDMGGQFCFVCDESISAPFLFCSRSRCHFNLHKSCADLPQQIRINFFHPQHPLFLLPKHSNECQICGLYLSSPLGYVCGPCNFCIHPRCAFSNSTHVIKRMRIISHSVFYEKWRKRQLRREFRAVELPQQEQPQQIQNNYFHPQHPLRLDSECGGECKICGQENDQPTYACKPCDFFCHLRCALLNPIHIIKSVGEKRIQHSSHHHSLTLLKHMSEWPWNVKSFLGYCDLCHKEVDSFPSYGCRFCKFILHKSCAELPTRIKSHLHPDHFLFGLPKPPREKSYCDCCAETILGLNYYCIQCGFILHLDCFLSRQGFQQLYDHKHCFIDLKTYTKLTCQTCGGEGYFSPWQCSSCHILGHKKCADLPSILKLVSHHHYFKLTYYLSLVHKCDEMICKLCYRKINVDYAAYYCSECKYAAHLECAPKVGRLVLEEEIEDGYHASKEAHNSITNSDISSSQDEDIKSGVIQHFSHQHELTLIEQDLEDHKYCDGCVTLIFPPFYSCKQCSFYLHKRCGESPRTTEHPFHHHLLTLDVVEDLVWCNECGYWCNGFIYSCQTPNCTFNLDLQCADILSEGLQHPCHEHPLFFPYTRKKEECKGCGKKEKHILVCSECDYVLGYCCLRIPRVAKHRYDNHLLKLTHMKENESGDYYCDICEEERDPEVWFYHCSQCDFFAHIDCTVGEFPHLKYGMTVNSYSHDHPLTLVEKCERKTPPLCSSCEICKDPTPSCHEHYFRITTSNFIISPQTNTQVFPQFQQEGVSAQVF